MSRVLFAAYGAFSYLVFLGVFVYAIAFVGDLPVPKTIDGGTPGDPATALIVDTLLLGLFAAQHSIMARPTFKRWWTRFVPAPIERSTYVLFASLALIVLFVFWQPLGGVVWAAQERPLATSLTALSWVGWAVVLVSTCLISHFELFGLKQVYDRYRHRPPAEPQFATPGLYRFVRHPLYLGFIVAFWATPVMTEGHLIFALGTFGYIVIAIQWEERNLMELFGDRYRVYRRQVGMLWPRVTAAPPLREVKD